MTEKPGKSSRFANHSSPTQAETEIQNEADANNSTYSKVKNFTSETNDNATTALLNILIDENKSTQKSIALLNRNIHELLVFLLKVKKAKDREQRF